MLKGSLLVFAFLTIALGFFMYESTGVVIAIPDKPPSLDPTTNASAAIDQILNQNVYEGLVRVTSSGEIEPALAASFEVSSDGRTYTFHLRQGFQGQVLHFNIRNCLQDLPSIAVPQV